MMALIPAERFYKSNWIEYHRNHSSMIKDTKLDTLLLGDSLVAGLSRYPNVWNEYFAPIERRQWRRSLRKCFMASHRFTFTVVREKYCNSVRNQ